MATWRPEVLDVRGDGYGFVMDQAQTARAVYSYGYPNPGLNVAQGNWATLSPAQLREARKFVEEKYQAPARNYGSRGRK